ncbi:hypothetical protein [Bdellovibrio bacteriovorus]|uniref:Uncharacterized protein n=1 Tax=Bdellovibrio bacteriovorus TaxID=959 RepID=A0A150WWB7_BDEBC|nr:hypothetical protein [Bdellovibrio bacteriovorus]KYG70729.1 hypothetical protein AZI85_02005 [Bdellovibrio bacteriovorus]
MNKISSTTDRTVVKIFINIIATASLLSSVASAQNTGSGNNNNQNNNNNNNSQGQQQQQVQTTGYPYVAPSYNECRDARDKMDRAEEKIGEACKKAGLGSAKDCISKAKSCGASSGEDSFDTTAAFATVLGLSSTAASGLQNISKACPQMNGRDYFTEKNNIQKEIKDTEKELAELNDDKAQIQEDYQKEMDKIQETLTKAQEDYKAKSLEIDSKERERIAEFNNSQNQAKEEMRKKGADILKLRGQVTQSQRDKALKLIAMTDASGKRACMKAVTEAKKSYESVSASTSSNHIAQAKKKRQELINIYNDCMDAFDQQRIALNESKKQEQDELNRQIADLQSSYDEIQNSLNLASSQLEEMKQSSLKEKSDALQSVIDLGTRSQTQMQTAYTKMQENLKTLATKQASLTAALNRANQSLMTLGPAPKRSAEDTADEASSEISSQINIISSIQRNFPSCTNEVATSKEKLKNLGVK